MNISQQISKHFKEVHYGGNWTAVNLKDVLSDVNFIEADTKIGTFNTIATLVFHLNYYISIIIPVLKGEPLIGSDELSFKNSLLNSELEWQNRIPPLFKEVDECAALIEMVSETNYNQPFTDEKYGNYLRNLLGVIEHTHYHLGQIVMIKKIIRSGIVA